MSSQTSKQSQKELDPKAKNNLQSLEEEIETSSQYFKPQPDNVYMISIDPVKDEIRPVINDRFKDAQGKPIKRYECKITHINNGKQQIWSVSKTVVLQLLALLKNNYTTMKVVRFGSDRTTTYDIQPVQ